MNPKQPNGNDFVVSLAGPEIDTTIVTIEEMQLYSQHRKRISLVGTEKKSYGQLDKASYQLVGNYTKPNALQINAKNKPSLDVYGLVLDKFKSGLLVVESDTLSDSVSDLLCNSPRVKANDIDIMICRDGLDHMTEAEMRKANLLRIHANPDFNPMFLNDQKVTSIYNEKIMSLMVCHLFVNDQYSEVESMMKSENKRLLEQGMTDYIDYYEYNKQLSFFLYYDVVHDKILNIGKETLLPFLKKCAAMGIPFPKDHHGVIAEHLTTY